MKYPDFIEELLLAKAYKDLTADEKQQVSEWLTNEEEYTKIRELLVGIETAFGEEEEELAPTHIKTTLEQAFAKKYKAKRLLTMRWQLVTTLSIAASLALVFYIGSLFIEQQKPTEVAVNTTKKEEVNIAPQGNSNNNNEAQQPDDEIKIDSEVADKTLSLPPPSTVIDENIITEDVAKVAEDDIEANRDKYFYTDETIENEKAPVAVEEVIIQKKVQKQVIPKTQRNTENIVKIDEKEIQALPQRSNAYYTSPSVPAGTFDVQEIAKIQTLTLSSSSLADNIELLDLGVEVY